jgi:hypothetical protein
MSNISKWFFGTRYLLTLTIVLVILWLIIFTYFTVEENKYKDDVVDNSGFARSFYEYRETDLDGNIIIKKKYYANAFTDSIYFISTMFGTFGYGDIYPKTNSAKTLVTIMHFIIVIFIMGLYENVFVTNETIKNLSIDLLKLADNLTEKDNKIRALSIDKSIQDNEFTSLLP